MDYFGDGSKMSVNIEYYFEKEPLGNAGALFRLRHRLTEDFLLLNADSIFDVDFKRFADYHNHCKGLATIFTHPNNHPYDSGLIITGQNHTVCQWLTKEEIRPVYYKNRVNAGIHMISPKLLNMETDSSKVDLDRQILKPLAGTGKLYAYDSTEYVSDMGTPERLERVRMDFRNGKVRHKNLRQPQKAIFLDRDGTINVDHGYVHEIDNFEFIDGVIDAMRELKKMGFALVVVTNQSGIARGKFTEAQFETLTEWMDWSLADRDVDLDGIYYCPHHPQGSVEEFRQVCDCRKPHPGMLLSARDYLHIDMAASYMVGDKLEDMQAAAAANVGTKVLVRTGKPITPEAENAADWVLNSLADLPQAIKKQQKPA